MPGAPPSKDSTNSHLREPGYFDPYLHGSNSLWAACCTARARLASMWLLLLGEYGAFCSAPQDFGLLVFFLRALSSSGG